MTNGPELSHGLQSRCLDRTHGLALVLAAPSVTGAANFTILMGRGRTDASVIAGNRKIALFLVALPAETMDDLLLFIGCYQIPMYLTPILMGGLPAPKGAATK